MDNTFLKVPEQVPEFVKESYPRFIEFLEEYYKFLSQYNTSIEHSRTSGVTSADLYSFVRREIASKFPQALINDLKLSATIRKLFQSKGTFNSIELLFRIFFNESIIIRQPGKNVLRASDGRWKIEKSMLVETLLGNIDFTRQNVLTIDNDRGRFFVEILRYEEVSPGVHNFFFSVNNIFEVVENQLVSIYINNALTYQGRIKLSPSYLNIINPGKYWKIGQVFRLPGSVKDTIVKVNAVDSDGGVQSTEIYEYGYDHTENQLAFISPLPYKPAQENYELTTNIIGYNSDEDRYIFDYTLELNDSTQMTTDSVLGISDIKNQLSYFLEEYNNPEGDMGYNGSIVLSQTTDLIMVPDIFITSDLITIEEYNESISLFELKYEYIISHRGEFITDAGMLSNDNIRLQDNFFYQAFSYVIETHRNVQEYNNILNLIHPAGLKFFGELAKTAFIVTDTTVTSFVNVMTLYSYDGANIEEMLYKYLTKPLDEEILVEDKLSFELIKPFAHSVTAEDTWYKEIGLNKTESITILDAANFDATKELTHSVSINDSFAYEWIKYLTETSVINDSLVRQVSKHIETGTDPVTDTIFKNLIIQQIDSAVAVSFETKTFGKNLTNSLSISDEDFLLIIKNITDSININDGEFYINTEKWFETQVATDDGEFQNLEVIAYNEEEYFAPGYVATDNFLTIS